MKMSQEGEKPPSPLKIYANKPKKALRKPIQDQHQIFSTHHTSPPPPPSSTMASQSSAPPQPPKESFARRYKFVWPLFLAANLGVGVYVLTRTTKKATEEEVITVAQTTPTTTSSTEKPIPLPSITEPVKVREPIPEHQQREAFKWILEEKRKVKPNNPEEKKRLDEEKAILKQFIRAKSIPSI